MWSIKIDIRIVSLSWIENDETLVAINKDGEIVAIEVKTAEIFGEFGILEENESNKDSARKELRFLNNGADSQVSVF